MNDYEDAKLIADAPLLLEEVKQLRETIIAILSKHCILHEGEWSCDKCQEVIE